MSSELEIFLDDDLDVAQETVDRAGDWFVGPDVEEIMSRINILSREAFCNIEHHLRPQQIQDFPYSDVTDHFTGAPGLNLQMDDRLLERSWIFQIIDKDCEKNGLQLRLILHGHTGKRWGARETMPVPNRAEFLTSVTARVAHKRRSASYFKERSKKYRIVPRNHVDWRNYFITGRADAICWNWRD